MPMDLSDQRYFGEQFGLVHKRINDSEKAQTEELHKVTNDQNKKITEIREAISAHKLATLADKEIATIVITESIQKALRAHVAESRTHNPAKALGFVALFAGVCGAIWGFVVWLVKYVFPVIKNQ